MKEHEQNMQERKESLDNARAEEERKKNEIFKKIEADNISKRKMEESEQKFKEELQEAMHERDQRMLEKARMDKVATVKAELLKGKKADEIIKKKRIQENRQLEEEFKKNILAKFAEDDRIEIYNKQKKQQLITMHKQKADDLW